VSQENVEIVLRLCDAAPEVQVLLGRGGDRRQHPRLGTRNALSRRWTEAPDADSYHGREGAGRYFERDFNEVWSEWRFRPQEFVDGPEGVLVAVANSGLSRSGIEVNMPIFQTFRLRDGMVVHTKASSMATGAQSRGTKRVGSVAENMETT